VTRRTPTVAHWGNYTVVSDNGRVLSLEPARGDSAPSPIGSGMADAQHAAVRITQPMVREGCLADRPGPANGRRGRDRCVPVSHDHALDLVSPEVERVRSTFGNAAIYASSYGWSSAGGRRGGAGHRLGGRGPAVECPGGLAGAVVTDEVRPGVVVLATGAWFDPEEPGVSGSLERHGNPNVLTAGIGTSRLAQGSTSGTTLVEAERVDPTTAPEPRPFVPPETVDPGSPSAQPPSR
jgi:anaerobic selenocysteine-containing dehydrogenase